MTSKKMRAISDHLKGKLCELGTRIEALKKELIEGWREVDFVEVRGQDRMVIREGMPRGQLISSAVTEIRLIEETLERLRDRRYGICKECRNEIDPRRLKALPCVTRCIICQRNCEAEARLSSFGSV